MVLAPKLGPFARDYPDVVLDVTTTNEMRLDLVAGHFDAGIHLGEFIERDMIAVRVSADQRAAIVGLLKAHPKPKSPHDLTRRSLIRRATGLLTLEYREIWRAEMHRVLTSAVCVLFFAIPARAQLLQCIEDSPERHGQPGCSVVADKPMPSPPPRPAMWHIDEFSSLAEPIMP